MAIRPGYDPALSAYQGVVMAVWFGCSTLIAGTWAAAALALASGLSACKPSSASPANDDAGLTARDLYASARLSKAERDRHVARCVAKRYALVGKVDLGRQISGAQIAAFRASVDTTAPPFCDCFVSQIEDRASKLQFVMTMTVIDKGEAGNPARAAPEIAAYQVAALKHGMAAGEFDKVRREIGPISQKSIEQCVSHLTGR